MNIDIEEDTQPISYSASLETSLLTRIKLVISKLWTDPKVKRLFYLSIVSFILAILVIVFRSEVLWVLQQFKKYARMHKLEGSVIVISAIFIANFPPMIGYGTFLVISGFLFNVWGGFVVNFIGGILGTIACFALSRYWFKNPDRNTLPGFARPGHVNTNLDSPESGDHSTLDGSMARSPSFMRPYSTKKSAAAAYDVINRLTLYLDRYPHKIWKMLFLLRLGSFPYNIVSFSLGQISSISFAKYSLVSTIALFKTIIHAFIGSSLANLTEIFHVGGSNEAAIVEIVFASLGAVIAFLGSIYIARMLYKAVNDNEYQTLRSAGS